MRVLPEARRLQLDQGRAQTWQGMADGTSKKSKLISERIGLTNQMLGIDAVMADALLPYKVLIERLQVQTSPIGHCVRRWITVFFRETNEKFLENGGKFGKHFQKWQARDDVSDALADQVKNMGRTFVFHFLTNCRFRLQPYWQLLMAMETINPCAPYKLSPDAWTGVIDLCKRVGMTADQAGAVVRDLKSQHVTIYDYHI